MRAQGRHKGMHILLGKFYLRFICYRVNGKYCLRGAKGTLYFEEAHHNRFQSSHESSILAFVTKREKFVFEGAGFRFSKGFHNSRKQT